MNKLLLFCIASLATVLCASADNDAWNFPAAIIVAGETNTSLTASLPVFTDGNKMIVSKTVAATKTALGIQTGSGVTVTDGTVTNTFATAFSSAPTVTCTQTGTTLSTTNIITSITASNFVIKTSLVSTTNNYIAVGPP